MSKESPNIGKPSIYPSSVINFYFELIGKNKTRFFIVNLTISLLSFFIPFLGLQYVNFSWSTFFNIGLATISFAIFAYTSIIPFLKNNKLEITKSNKLQKIIYQTYHKDIARKKGDVLQPSKLEENEGYKRIDLPYRSDSIIMSKKVNSFLRDSVHKIKLNIIPNRKKELLNILKPDAELLKDALLDNYALSRKKNKMFFNDDKISLTNTPCVGLTTLNVFKSSYYLSYVTHEMSTKNIEDKTVEGSNRIRWQGIKKFPYQFDPALNINRLKSLEDSNFSNHIGGNTIAFSDNCEMILWQQSSSAQRSEGLIAPTGSGSLDYSDYENNNNSLKDMIIEGMNRELSEESTLKNTTLENVADETKIIGFYRWTKKAGLPGFLGVSKIKSKTTLKPNSSEVKLFVVDSDNNLDMKVLNTTELIELINYLLKNEIENLSVPLYANLKALKQTATENPDFLNFIFK